jgi:hypothetical protein
MATLDLLQSWDRTESFLREALACLSDEEQARASSPIADFQEYLAHNELEIALEALLEAFEQSGSTNRKCLEWLALAAASMGLDELRRELDQRLTEGHGCRYETLLQDDGQTAPR